MASDYFIFCACVACSVCLVGVSSAPTKTENDQNVAAFRVASEEYVEPVDQLERVGQMQVANEKSEQTDSPASVASPIDAGQSDPVELDSYETLFEMSDVDLTPQAVAEYLLLSGDFTGFDDALADLVRARILSPLEVARYKRVVGWEYQNLLRQMLQAEANYLEMFAKPILESLVLSAFMEEDLAQARENETASDLQATQQAQHDVTKNESEANKPEMEIAADLDSLLNALMEQHEIEAPNADETKPQSTNEDSEKQLSDLARQTEKK